MPRQSGPLRQAITPAQDVGQRLADHASIAQKALSPHTLRALRSDTAIFAEWCVAHRLPSLPAEPRTVARFVGDLSSTRSTATLRRYVASIAAVHRAAGMAPPTFDESVRLAIKGAAVTSGTRQRQAVGLTEPDIQRIVATAGDRLLDLRDLALILAGRDLLARRSELVALDVADIELGDDGSATALVRRSKTDREGRGDVRWLSPRATRAITAWLAAAGIREGRAFRSVKRGDRVGGPLHPNEVSLILKRTADRARIDARLVSGHSLRVGMAQDLVASGAELPAVMQAGGWKTPSMPARYAERLLPARGAVARFYSTNGAS